ncbi:MAG: Tat pathway signal sequence domain protein [Caulobacteraceae bacterium]
MRRTANLVFVACAAFAWLYAQPVHAQYGGGGGQRQQQQRQQQEDQDAKAKKRAEEWGADTKNLPLPQLRNAGPCPYVKILYDAARYVQFKGGDPAIADVGFTGELENLSSGCEYKGDEPIRVEARLLFEFGRGPQAQGRHETYRYWVAVTDRNRAVLQKQYFELPVDFPPGHDRVTKTQDILGIVIPRANAKVSGGNFEVLVGFDVTPQMAAFNRDGERFRVNAGETQASVSPTR